MAVLSATDNGVTTLTLDSPHNRNALSEELVGELTSGLSAAAADPSVRVVVLTHSGGTFCAGADLREAGSTPGKRTQQMVDLQRAILECPRPVIGVIDGHVRAGGMGIVASCDIVVAGPLSTFALTESRLGLAPAIVSLTLLPRLDARAAGRYFLTGEKFGPEEAAAIGLISASAPDAGAGAADIVGALMKSSPQGLAESKALTTRAILADFDARASELAGTSARLFASDEAREGMMAFLEKRLPSWALAPEAE